MFKIGGTNAISRNVIAANGASGVSITSSANNIRVSRNQIGLSLSGGSLGNANAAIQLQGASNTIGGANATLSNTIGGSAHWYPGHRHRCHEQYDCVQQDRHQRGSKYARNLRSVVEHPTITSAPRTRSRATARVFALILVAWESGSQKIRSLRILV